MATPGELWTALEELDLKGIVMEALEERKEDYLEKNLAQLYEGMSPEEGKIDPPYKNAAYARKKNRMNAAPGYGVPDFYLTGAMYEETHVDILEDDALVIQSDVSYAKYNEERWGVFEIWGLTEENFDLFVYSGLQPIIIEKVSEQTGLK